MLTSSYGAVLACGQRSGGQHDHATQAQTAVADVHMRSARRALHAYDASAGATTSGATTTISDSDLIASASKQSQEAIESAVYAHLQAMRALGHAFINTSDVAKALGLPQSLVDGTIAALKKRGVKVA
jgi:hypothetical protein